MAKTKEPAQVYQLKISLRDIKPPLWRRVQVKDCTLEKLHEIIQTCMGWSNSHLHSFEIGGVQDGKADENSARARVMHRRSSTEYNKR
jgi:Plasmid pRiA4b ORF-3-like protein